MPIRCRTLRSFLEYWVFSATERLFPSKGALESDSRTGPDWIAPERRDYRNVAQVAFGLKIPHSDKTSCALGAPPSMKMGAAPCRAVNGLFSVGVEAIFIAADLSGLGAEAPGRNGDRATVKNLFTMAVMLKKTFVCLLVLTVIMGAIFHVYYTRDAGNG